MQNTSAAPARLVCVIVWDGLRPDWVTTDVTPTLHALATGGVWFERSHCAYPSETRVNAAALATGCYPGRTGITANSIFVPGFDLGAPLGSASIANTGDHTHLARVHEIDPPLLGAPTTADAVIAAGGVAVVASSGSPGSAFIQAGDPATGAAILNHALLRPAALRDTVLQRYGAAPPDSHPATGRSDWVTLGLLDHLIPEYVLPAVKSGKPALVHWWLTDPDHTAHSLGLGAPETVQSLRENDLRLAELIETLTRLDLLDHTDVLLTSDHGFSTMGPRRWDGRGLATLGLDDVQEDDESDVATTGQGGAITFGERSVRHAAAVVRRLQALEWVGAIFARDGGPAHGLPGVLPLSALWNGRVGRRAPDVLFSIAWTDEANVHGVPGTVLAGSWNPEASSRPAPGGTTTAVPRRGASHGSASPFDMRNSLFAWGPRFKKGLRSDLPAGVVDVAPTIRHLLNLSPVDADGRLLTEALAASTTTPTSTTETLEAALPDNSYHQTLTLARVANTTYVTQATAARGPSGRSRGSGTRGNVPARPAEGRQTSLGPVTK